MKILSFDVSTTTTGCVLYNTKTKEHKHWIFESKKKSVKERIFKIARSIFAAIEEIDTINALDKKFDVVLVTQAKYSVVSEDIALLEGMILSLAITYNANFERFPDVSWYSSIGSIRDERTTKKKNSIATYLKNNDHLPEVIDTEEIWKSSKVDKIIVRFNDGSFITDDVSDAWNAARFYTTYQQKQISKKVIELWRQDIKTFEKDILRINKKIFNIETKLRLNAAEKERFVKEYAISQSNSLSRSIKVREDRHSKLAEELNQFKIAKAFGEEKISNRKEHIAKLKIK